MTSTTQRRSISSLGNNGNEIEENAIPPDKTTTSSSTTTASITPTIVDNQLKNVCVIVLGDIGRSPRMQYHVKSLQQHKFIVDVIGYVETAPLKELTNNEPNTKIHKLLPFPDLNLPRTIKYVFKTIWQMLTLLITLFNIRRPHFMLCQNPPAIPTIFICYFYCMIFRCKFIIDWHNYTYSILALDSNQSNDSGGGGGDGGGDGGGSGGNTRNSLIVRIAKLCESYFGRKSWHNFCVTNAMKEDLNTNWNITRTTVFYDRPYQHFQTVNIQQKHDLFMRLSQDYPVFLSDENGTSSNYVCESTAITEKLLNGVVQYKNNRPGIIVSSTSWTPDEDFNVLLKALEVYEQNATTTDSNDPSKYPNLICIITGKGPLKEFYLEVIQRRKWKKCVIITPWLEIEDYPMVLASADIGVCLHYSSSGLDLPMKVVDMFGCRLPVCAINFQCLNELVKHERNGFIFEDYKQLADQLLNWFYEYPNNLSLINIKEIFQRNLREFQSLNWDENWKRNCLPIFTD